MTRLHHRGCLIRGFIGIALSAIALACGLSGNVQTTRLSRIYAVVDREGTKLDTQVKREIAGTVLELSETYQIDPMLILAVMKVESQFDLEARSHRGAIGLMQIRPIVVREVADDLGLHPQDDLRLSTDHEFNLRVGVHYLASLLKRCRGDLRKALMAYNVGPTKVVRLYRNRPAPSGGYQGKVLRTYRSFTTLPQES